MKIFVLQEEETVFLELLNNAEWIAKLSYLADIFALLNEPKSSLQGARKDAFSLRENINALTGEITLRDF